MEMTGGPNVLTEDERTLLQRFEESIERREAEDFGKAWAFRAIKEKNLHRESHPGDFDGYCKERWGHTKGHVNRLIRASETADDLRARGLSMPRTEKQTRPLVPLSAKERAAVVFAVEREGGFRRVSARRVEEIVELITGRKRTDARPKKRPATGLVLVSRGGAAGPSASAQHAVTRYLREMAEAADRIQRLGPYAVEDVVAAASEVESNALRDYVARAARPLQRFAEAWEASRGEQPEDGQQTLTAAA